MQNNAIPYPTGKRAEILTDDEILDIISDLITKRNYLEAINKAGKFGNIFIFLEAGDSRQMFEINQSNLPFSLSQEIRILVNDSMDQIHNQIENAILLIQHKINAEI